MAGVLGNLVYYIRAKNDDFKRAIAETKQSINGMNTTFQNSKKQVQDWGTSITNNLTKIETSLKKTGDNLSVLGQKISMKISLPLALASGAAIKLAMDAVESENLFTESMGKMANSARKWSEDLRKNLGLNAYEIRQNIGVFNVMLMSMGLTEEAAFGMSKGLTQLAYDMSSFYNLKPEVAFEKLQAGISGESEPLKRLGIIVNETTIKNYALTHGLIKQGEELNETGKVVARYGTIMEATSKAQGDLARTIDSPANKLRILQSELKQTTIDLGMALLPTFQSLIKMSQPLVKVLENIATWFNKLSPATQEAVGYLIALTIASGPCIKALGLLFKVGSGVVSILKLLTQGGIIAAIKGIGTAFVSAATGATTATVATTGLATAFTPFLLGGVIVAGLIGIVAWLGKIREHAKLAATDIANISDIDTMQKKIKQLQDDIAKEKLRLKKESQGTIWYNNFFGTGKTFRPDFSKLDKLTEDLNEAQEKLKTLKVNPSGLDTETLKKEIAETIAAIQKEMANSFKLNAVGELKRTAYEKAKDQFETFAASGASAESQLAKWHKLTNAIKNTLKGEELDDYKKKLTELEKAAEDAVQKAQNELALTKITDAQENELKQLELSYEEQTKGMRNNDKEKIALTEKYNIERQRITEKWGKEKLALEKENEAIDARARGDYEAAALADEEARYTREINDLTLTAEQKEKIEKDHEQEVVDIKKQCAGEREALLKESQAIELRLKGEYENADIAEEDARWAREKSSLIEGTTEYQNALKQHEEKVKQIKRDYTEDWAAANLEFKKGELDLRIQGLETEKQMAELGPNKYIAKRNILELEKQIVGLKLEQLDLDIKDLERQRDKAIELKDQLKAKQLQNQIDQAKLSKKSLQSDLDYDIASYNFDRSMYTEVHDSLESAIRDGFEDGKNIASSFADYLGDVLKQKVYKAMADAMLNSSAGQSLTGSIGSIVAGIFGGGKTPTQTPVGTNSESGAINPGNGGLLGSIFSKGKGSLIDNFKSLFSGGGTKAFGALLPQLGMLGLGANLLGGLFGGGSDTAMNISANTAKMDIDFATANFKTVTLPKTYMSSQSGTTRNANSVAPVVNVNINAAGNIITERDLQKTMKETANEVYSARKVAGEKWSEATVNGVDINDY